LVGGQEKKKRGKEVRESFYTGERRWGMEKTVSKQPWDEKTFKWGKTEASRSESFPKSIQVKTLISPIPLVFSLLKEEKERRGCGKNDFSGDLAPRKHIDYGKEKADERSKVWHTP